ncbi:hypothetical protein BLOT_012891 [Blomia tropicalis]|nr:hypothetical protein BLOT_012891 [Blomia tropicalis]
MKKKKKNNGICYQICVLQYWLNSHRTEGKEEGKETKNEEEEEEENRIHLNPKYNKNKMKEPVMQWDMSTRFYFFSIWAIDDEIVECEV